MTTIDSSYGEEGMEVDLREFERNVFYFRNINSLKLKELKFMFEGKEIKPETEDMKRLYEEFEDVGLMNTDFIKMLIDI